MDNAVFQNEIIPFYFGTSPKRLYGCHHLPQRLHAKACAVVLCYPIGQEYIRSHRAFYQLAVRLSQVGFHVLRFDYFGCGDSNGDFEEGSFFQWVVDIHRAIEEIQNRSGVTSVCLAGLRIGATLALKAAVDCHDVDSLILWEPVLHGKIYLKELAESQQVFLRSLQLKSRWVYSRAKMPGEAFGFPITSNLKKDLESINRDQLRLRPNVKLLTVYNSEESNRVNRQNYIKGAHHTDSQLIVDQRVWVRELYKRLIPVKTLDYLVNWADTIHS
jgi:alpha/beta superfamily hydrolase